MRYADSKGNVRRLTTTQAAYLLTADRCRPLPQGWGGMASTFTVRLLEERGLVTVSWRGNCWTVTSLTHRGAAVLARWRTRVP